MNPVEAQAVLVLCGPCTERIPEDKAWFEAKFGPQGLGPDDVAILCASRLIDLRDVTKMRTLTKLTCEHCETTVYVARSSQWLLDLKRKLDA